MTALTICEYSFFTPADLGGGRSGYRAACQTVGLSPVSGGYGLLHCVDESGERWTAVTTDVDYLRFMVAESQAHKGLPGHLDLISGPPSLAGLVLPPNKFARKRPGWPDEWARSDRAPWCDTSPTAGDDNRG